MSEFKPQDNEARNTIEHALDETLFVEAGAGTGKTTSLVNRILELVGKRRNHARQGGGHHLHRSGGGRTT